MLDTWEIWLTGIVFGLGLLVSIGMGIATLFRGMRNTERFVKSVSSPMGTRITVDMQPISPYSKDYEEIHQTIVYNNQMRDQQTTMAASNKTVGQRTVTTTTVTEGQQNANKSGGMRITYVNRDNSFISHWLGIHAPAVSIVTPVLVAFVLLVLYIALYLGLGTFTRTDTVVANYLTWVSVAINYTALVVSFLFITGGFKTGVRVVQLFGVGVLTFLIGTSFALGSICSGDTQWLGMGAGLFLHIIVGLLLLFLLRDEFMADCGLYVTRACTIIRWAMGVTWVYFTIKAIFLILAVEYTAVMTVSQTNIAQVVTDVVFYITLTILGYIAAARIERHKKDRMLQMYNISYEHTMMMPYPQQPGGGGGWPYASNYYGPPPMGGRPYPGGNNPYNTYGMPPPGSSSYTTVTYPSS